MKTFLCGLMALSAVALADNVVVKVVDDKGQSVPNAEVCCLLRSGAYQMAKLDKTDGAYKAQPAEECIKVFVGAAGHEAAVKKASGKAGVFDVVMKPSATKGSAVIQRAGFLPGIKGSVNPIIDSSKRLFLYTTQIGLQKGGQPAQQPIEFALNRPIDAQTATGQKFKIYIVEITQEVSLLEFTTPK